MKNLFPSITAILLFFCLIAPAAVMGQDLLDNMDIHGFVSQGFVSSSEYNYLTHNSKDGSFEYNEVGINFGKQMTPKLGFGIQFFARDLGDVANNKVTLDWAFGDYRAQDWLGFRFGKIKLPLGIWNEIRDYDMLRPWIVLPQNFVYFDLSRDSLIAANGLGLYGNFRLGTGGNLDYYLVGGNTNADMDSGISKYINNAYNQYGMELSGESEAEMLYVGNLRWNTPLPGLMVGIWTFISEVTFPLGVAEATIENTYTGLMVEYLGDKISLWAEYIIQDTENEIKTPLGSNKEDIRPESYYLGAAYQFTLWFQLGAYYSESYIDGDDKDGSDLEERGQKDHRAWEKDMALTLRFDLNEYWVLKMEGHMVDGTKNVLSADNTNLSKQSFYYTVAKLSVSF